MNIGSRQLRISKELYKDFGTRILFMTVTFRMGASLVYITALLHSGQNLTHRL